jgi:hypothetical protein
MYPSSPFLYGGRQVTDCMDAHTIGGECLGCWRATAERAVQCCRVNDVAGNVDSIPRLQASFTDMLVTASTTACRAKLIVMEVREAEAARHCFSSSAIDPRL